MSPDDFARHSGKMYASTKWKSQIWVFSNDGNKLHLHKTCLLKHYTHNFQRPQRQVIHRDEFKKCCRCHKDRRFVVRTKEACKAYHDALVNDNWTCSDMPGNS